MHTITIAVEEEVEHVVKTRILTDREITIEACKPDGNHSAGFFINGVCVMHIGITGTAYLTTLDPSQAQKLRPIRTCVNKYGRRIIETADM